MSTPAGGPPKPPPLRNPPAPPSPLGELSTENPFGAPSPENAPASNPFLSEEVPPAAPGVVTSPSPGAVDAPTNQSSVPATQDADRAAASVRGRAGAESPVVRDAHAEFRKGRWKTAAAFVIAASVAAIVLFVLASEPQEEVPVSRAPVSRQDAVIGSSVSPQVIEELKEEARPAARAKMEPSDVKSPPMTRTADSSGFADAFKSGAN